MKASLFYFALILIFFSTQCKAQQTQNTLIYKNEISLGYDVGLHLLFETLGESILNHCYDEYGCDKTNFDYGIIKLDYKRYLNAKWNLGARLSFASTFETKKLTEDEIISSTKYLTLPMYVQYNYINNDHFSLSSSLGIAGRFALNKDEIINDFALAVIPVFYVELINFRWTFGKQKIHPFVSTGFIADLLVGGVSYKF